MSLRGAPMQMKSMNKKRVLQCIQENSPISRAEIATQMNLSKPTISLIVDELIKTNWVYEKGIGPSSSHGGRKPIQLFFNEKAAYVIGTDIGGTKVKTIVSDLSGNVLHSKSFSTSHYLQTGLLDQIAKDVFRMLDHLDIPTGDVLGMGIGVPGITQNGVVLEAPSLNWIRYPILSEAEKHFPFPIHVDNDVNVAALGEQWVGSAKNNRHVLFMAVGTGIGSGIIINNQLYRGHSNAAGEIGYMVTDKDDLQNDFKPMFHRYGYLESVAGGKSIGHKLTTLVLENPDHPAYEEAKQSELSGESAFQLAKSGDPTALSVVHDAIDHLGYGIINAACLLNPEVIILGGGVLKSSDFILPRLRKMVDQYLPSSVELKISQLGGNVGVLGAVSLFLREHEGLINF
jgi:glucokinase